MNRKEEAEAAKRNTPSVSAAVPEASSNTTASTSTVTVASVSAYNDPVVFYIAHETRWMLDSGCSDHITHKISDFHGY